MRNRVLLQAKAGNWPIELSLILRMLVPTPHCPIPPPPALKWKAPPSGFFKINVNGATSNDGINACIGVIVRDCQGLPIVASSEVLQSSYLAEITEAFALLHGVLLALDLKISHAIFESDALSII